MTTPIATITPTERPTKVRFASADAFYKTLKSRVEAYFERTGKKERDCAAMYIKTAIILCWFLGSYVALVFFCDNAIHAAVAALSAGLAMAAIGFNIQHDGGHKAYSKYPWVNRIMATTLDMIGGSSFVWDHQHNTIHHTFCNITGHDEDINLGFLGRMSPHQPRYFFHRIQHWYLWFFYGFLPIKWQLVDDFVTVAKGRLGSHKFSRPKGTTLAVFITGKLGFFTLVFGVPLLFHTWWMVLLAYALSMWVSGIVIAVVFQLAHVVEESSFPMPDEETLRMESAWAVHQVETTVDFAQNSPFLTWYLGGLNYQIEHHLFSRICHVHYPALSKLVRETCDEFGIMYRQQPTIFGAIRSHFRWLRQMGQPSPA